MAAEILVGASRGSLTPAMIDAGRTLIAQIRERIPIDAAFWLYLEDRERWRLMLATPLVGQQGKIATYRQIQALLDARPERRPYGMNDLELDDVTVIDSGDELLRLWHSAYPEGIRSGELRTTGVSIAGRYFEGAYFYLL